VFARASVGGPESDDRGGDQQAGADEEGSLEARGECERHVVNRETDRVAGGCNVRPRVCGGSAFSGARAGAAARAAAVVHELVDLPAAVEIDLAARAQQFAQLHAASLHTRLHPGNRKTELSCRLRLRAVAEVGESDRLSVPAPRRPSFEHVSVEFTHEVADGMHGAIVKAVKSPEPEHNRLPAVPSRARAGCC
jgi:hypothetical protein